MSTTLYKHEIFCLHGVTGQIAADVGAADTTILVDAAVLADPTIAVGSQIELDDGVSTSLAMTILAIDGGASQLTVDAPPGQAFLAGTPTDVVRRPRWAIEWKEDDTTLLTICPDNPAHPVQPGSAKITEIRKPQTTTIRESSSDKTRPHVGHIRVDAAPGQQDATGTRVFGYDVTVKAIRLVTEKTQLGDLLDFTINPDFPVGNITQAVGVDATVIPVSAAVLSHTAVAHLAKLREGPMGSETINDLGEVLAIDAAAGTVTVEKKTTDAFTTAAVFLDTICLTSNFPLPSFQTVLSGEDRILGSDVPAGFPFVATYRNNGPEATTAIFSINYLV